MKLYLILAGALGAAFAHAQVTPEASVRQVSLSRPSAPPAVTSTAPASPRQLSAEDRAELRRQLYQYRRLSAKAQ